MKLCSLICAFALSVSASLHAQVLPREKRETMLEKIPALSAVQSDDYAERVAGVSNAFFPEAAVTEEGPVERGPSDLELILRRDLRVSGVFDLGEGRQFVFLNSRRMSPGEEARIQVGGRELRIRLIEIGAKSITISCSGQTITLPTR